MLLFAACGESMNITRGIELFEICKSNNNMAFDNIKVFSAILKMFLSFKFVNVSKQ